METLLTVFFFFKKKKENPWLKLGPVIEIVEPLVLMTPKKLLRLPVARFSLD